MLMIYFHSCNTISLVLCLISIYHMIILSVIALAVIFPPSHLLEACILENLYFLGENCQKSFPGEIGMHQDKC